MGRRKKSRVERVIFTPDWHVPFHDKEALHKFFCFLDDYKPDEVILGGNINDCSAFSAHPKSREVALMFKTARDERKHWFTVASDLRSILPDTKINYIGSRCHEGWLELWATRIPAIADDPNYEIQNWFHLDDYNIGFVEDEYVKHGFVFTHGTIARSDSGSSAKQELLYHGTSGASGHTHRLASYYQSVRGKPLVWFESGCMCNRDSWYRLKGKMKYMNWQQGFLLMQFDGEMFSGQLIPVTRNSKDEPKITYGGIVY